MPGSGSDKPASDALGNGPCPAGFFCLQGTVNPTPCPEGTHWTGSYSNIDSTDTITLTKYGHNFWYAYKYPDTFWYQYVTALFAANTWATSAQ